MRVQGIVKLALMGSLTVAGATLLGCHHDTVETSSGVGGPIGQPGANGLDNGPGSNGTGAGGNSNGTTGAGNTGTSGTGSAGR